MGEKQYFIPPGTQPASDKVNYKKNEESRDINPGKCIDKITKLYLSVKQPDQKQRDDYGNKKRYTFFVHGEGMIN